jgi:5-methylcytosine-specific restriction protein A
MPTRAGRPCRWPGCPEIIPPQGAPYCPAHASEASRQYEAQRPSSSRRGYGANWRKVRAMYLARCPICEDPEGQHRGGPPVLASEVHHIKPLAEGGTNKFSNLQALCKSCHSRLTAKASGWVPRPAEG